VKEDRTGSPGSGLENREFLPLGYIPGESGSVRTVATRVEVPPRVPILPDLQNPCDVLYKLRRERIRVLRAEDDAAVVDHFLNFCISGWAMSDYVKHAFALSGAAGRTAYSGWLGNPLIAACRDIANRTKHFKLNKDADTIEVKIARRGVVDVYETGTGELITDLREDAPVIRVILDDGTGHDMWQFLHGVIAHWDGDLRSRGMACP
jgi:hypothetical protein